jgi:hypothetical protein
MQITQQDILLIKIADTMCNIQEKDLNLLHDDLE